jgi:hypothetical protein
MDKNLMKISWIICAILAILAIAGLSYASLHHISINHSGRF